MDRALTSCTLTHELTVCMPKPAMTACVLTLALTAPAVFAKDYPIQPVPFTNVHVDDVFWRPRMETNRKVTVWYDFKKCEETGRIDNFAKAAKLMPGEFKGTYFDDSDVYKVIEGAAYSLAVQYDEKLDKYLDDLIDKIAKAQEPDGYLYTCRTINPAKAPKNAGPTRWSNLVESHELYCVGHLYEAAVAHYQVTGKKTLLNVAIKSADLIDKTFGPNGLHDVPGHEEIEIGLVKLFRVTGDERYLKLAKFFIDQRGHTKGRKSNKDQAQDHKPVIEQDEPVGHAVRAGYLYTGMADVAAITGDQQYMQALDKIWNVLVSSKLYITGGIGSQGGGEAFGPPYHLPNAQAYAETCAAIANGLWNHRMFLLHGDAKYIDVLERVIYNGFLSGVSLEGDKFFYVNPLATDGKKPFKGKDVARSPWFGCACCPVNVVRFVPSIAGYVYATKSDALYVNLYVAGEAKPKVAGADVRIVQKTQYPWDGKIRIELNPSAPTAFDLCLRIPGWASARPVPSDLYRYQTGGRPARDLKVNGQYPSQTEGLEIQYENGYERLRREWKPGDFVELSFPMLVERVYAHEKVTANTDLVALQRGPIVYCVEGVDHGGELGNVRVPDAARFKVEHRPQLLGGITVVTWPIPATQPADGAAATATAIPYYAWNHRGPTEMAVWIPRSR